MLFRGDYHPAELYKADTKISGFKSQTFSGERLTINSAYNDEIEEIRIEGGFVPTKNLLNKKLFIYDAFKNETPWKGYGTIILSHSNLMTMLEPNKTYTISYDVTCLSVPTEGSIFHQAIGLSIRSGVGDNPPLGAHLWRPLVEGESYRHIATFTTPSNFSDEDANYHMVAYTNRYVDDAGNNYYANVLFKNIQIEEGNIATDYELYKEPTQPAFIWNGLEYAVPYTLFKTDSGFDYIKHTPKEGTFLYLFSNNSYLPQDISATELGTVLSSFTSSPDGISASISEGTLNITLKMPI